jgi:hypothetical protein
MTGIGGWTEADITRAMRQGIDNQNMPLCRQMPRFIALSDEEVAAIAQFLLELPPVMKAIPSSTCD